MLKPGLMIGERYEIIELVGSGGMADVYKAKCHKLNRFVAIKVLKKEFSEDQEFLTKFRVEAQSAAGLSHPNIVNIFDVGDEDGISYIVMELVEGITLKDYIAKHGRVDAKDAVDFASQIASGIETAHNNHIIHRDIKPQNIIVSNSGTLKVTDFGIAKAATSNTIATTNAAGSVHYISPEQARGGFCDEKSDIYSLGITLYEMVTGRVPFDGDSNVTVALQHIQGTAVPPREYFPDIPKSLEKVIMKCIQKKSDRRYLSSGDLKADLRRVLANPDGDFVKIMPIVDDSPTVMISDGEVQQIKEEAAKTPAEPDKIDVFPVKPRKEKRDFLESLLEEEDSDLDDEVPAIEGTELEEDEEEDDEGKMDPKLEKLIYILGIVAAVLIIMIVMYIIGNSLNLFKFGKKNPATEVSTTESTVTTELEEGNITVPNLVGDTLSVATEKLEALGLTISPEYKESEIEKDRIIEQKVESGTKLSQGDTVSVVVSLGKAKVRVPDVSDCDEAQAKSRIESEGLVYKPDYEYHDSVASGKAIRSNPSSQSEVEPGSTVTVYFSKGPKETTVTVPDFEGLTQANAEKLANQKGLILRVVEKSHATVAKGLVISQDTKINSEVAPNSIITITVSTGPENTVTKYTGNIRIRASDSPLEDGESGTVVLTLYQGNNSKNIYSGTITNNDFPLNVNFEGFYAGDASIRMYLNGQQVGVWTTTVSAVN